MKWKSHSLNNTLNVIILVIYVALSLFIVSHHEAWRDESQAWVIARNASFSQILGLCASEGHPFLWFYIVKICILCGLPFYNFSLLSVLIMMVAAALLLWKSPFHFFSKLCILLSPAFFYYDPVICRIYAVLVLLVTLLCIWWPKRRESPIIYGFIVALLFQSHIMIAGLGIGCLIEMMNNKSFFKKRNLMGFLIPLCSLICMYLELRQTSETETFIHINGEYLKARILGRSISEMTGSVTGVFNYELIPAGGIFICIGLLITVFFFVLYIRDKVFRSNSRGIGFVSYFGIAFFWGIVIFVKDCHIQNAIILWILFLGFVWLISIVNKSSISTEKNEVNSIIFEESGSESKKSTYCVFEVLFVIACIVIVPKCIKDAVYDINEPFSGSLEMAKIIEDKAPEQSVIVLSNDNTNIVAYLADSKKKFLIWDIDNGKEYTIHKWGKQNKRNISSEQLYETICSDIDTDENVFFVNYSAFLFDDIPFHKQMHLIDENAVYNKWDEYYQLYRVDVDK